MVVYIIWMRIQLWIEGHNDFYTIEGHNDFLSQIGEQKLKIHWLVIKDKTDFTPLSSAGRF